MATNLTKEQIEADAMRYKGKEGAISWAQVWLKCAIKGLYHSDMESYENCFIHLMALIKVMDNDQKKYFSFWLKEEKKRHPIRFIKKEFNKKFLELFKIQVC